MTDQQLIRDIKTAVDLGLTVTLAASAAYTVIKTKDGRYLIAFRYGSTDANFIGLHGMAGTPYEYSINHRGDWIVSGTIKD